MAGEADLGAHRLRLPHGVEAGHGDLSGGGAQHGGHDLQQRGLAGAIAAEQSQRLPTTHVQAHAIEHHPGAEVLADRVPAE